MDSPVEKTLRVHLLPRPSVSYVQRLRGDPAPSIQNRLSCLMDLFDVVRLSCLMDLFDVVRLSCLMDLFDVVTRISTIASRHKHSRPDYTEGFARWRSIFPGVMLYAGGALARRKRGSWNATWETQVWFCMSSHHRHWTVP
jgi:hypothetical protein